MISGIFGNVTKSSKQTLLIVAFIAAHIFFAVFLGCLYALAPDEAGYIQTFNNVYTLPIGTSAQSGRG